MHIINAMKKELDHTLKKKDWWVALDNDKEYIAEWDKPSTTGPSGLKKEKWWLEEEEPKEEPTKPIPELWSEEMTRYYTEAIIKRERESYEKVKKICEYVEKAKASNV